MTYAVLTRVVLWFGISTFVLAIGFALVIYGEQKYSEDAKIFGDVFIVFAGASLAVWAMSMALVSLHEQQAGYYYDLNKKANEIVCYMNDNLEDKRKDAYQKELDKLNKKINREEKYMSMKDWLEYDNLIKELCKTRIANDIANKVNRSNVPPDVSDKQYEKFINLVNGDAFEYFQTKYSDINIEVKYF